jgi:hypothetical protein
MIGDPTDLRVITARGRHDYRRDSTSSQGQAWRAAKATLLVGCLFLGLKALESFLIYSFQAGGLSGLSRYRDRYDLAKSGQLLALVAFLASQVVGGAMLRGMVADGAASWGERTKSLLLFSLGMSVRLALVGRCTRR